MRQNKILRNFIFTVLIFFFIGNIADADETHKVNEAVTFGRSYEFEEPSIGKIEISGAYESVTNFGDESLEKYDSSVAVSAAFTPKSTGVYKLDILITGKSNQGDEFSRSDVIYFVVTEDGRDIQDTELQEIINTSIENNSFVNDKDIELNRPYIQSINIKNAKLVGEISKDKTEYNIEVEKNAQEIVFEIEANSASTKIEGIFVVNPNEQEINIFSLSNDVSTIIYTFRWAAPELTPFIFVDENDKTKELYYNYKSLPEYFGLETESVEIKGDVYTVLKDSMGNLLIPLKEKFSSSKPDLYTFTLDGEILARFGKFININGEIYIQDRFYKIFGEDQRLFNLEETEIQNLSSARGYKINRIGYENMYLIRLTRPDGLAAWYFYNLETKELNMLDLPENLFEHSLAKLFGIKLETNYNNFKFSYYDIALMAIAFISLLIVIILSYRGKD